MPSSSTADLRGAARLSRTRVAVLADQRLVGELVTLALRDRGMLASHFAWPRTVRQTRETARQVLAFRPLVGVAVGDLDDAVVLHEAVQVLSVVPATWVVLTATPPGPAWGAALQAGAREVLQTDTSVEQVVAALHRAAARLQVMPPEQRLAVLDEWVQVEVQGRRLVERMRLLTARETAVLAALYEGSTVRSIAEDSEVSESTVRSQVKSVLRKLGVGSQLEAVAAYRRVREMGSRISATDVAAAQH